MLFLCIIIFFFILAKKCTHLAKGLNLPQLRKVTGQGKNPHECEDCARASPKSDVNEDVESRNQTSAPANEVSSSETVATVQETEENVSENEQDGAWICLQCGFRGCGRNKNQHALAHFKTPRSSPHDLVVNSLTWMTWCYKCDDYVTIESARLTEAIDFIRKHYGITSKPVKVLSMKRSQSQFDTKETVSRNEQSSEKVNRLSIFLHIRRYNTTDF